MAEKPLNELIQNTKESVVQAKTQLLKTFEFVPDDKLNWSPSPTARTPVWIAAHCGASNLAFAAILRGEEPLLPSDPKEAEAVVRAGGKEVTTRSEAVQSIEESTTKVLSALDDLTPDLLATTPNSPLGPLPFTVWMQVPAMHMTGHHNQLEYLQTIWGDIQTH